MDRIGVVDTMFARVDMGSIAENRLAGMEGSANGSRRYGGPCRASGTWPWPAVS